AALGHRTIGLLLGPSDHVPSNRKRDGARDAATRHHLEIADHRVARSTFSAEGGQAACGGLLDSGVTAIVCASDPLALGAIRAARRRGLHVPADVSVVGFDDSAFMKYTDPPLTTVRQPIETMGRAAVDRLVSQLEGRRDGPGELLYAPELVVRSSTGGVR
ncbi:MAG: substrate-binding domain-containing protein, partial [Ilumatobacteraceae bacterium]